jgi:uncharacterized protein (DUF362 family)/NAD-dependent dihydropyrimidine dehydrogenase PreA subunit
MGKSQIAVTKCNSYDIKEVKTAIDVCMDTLGGLDYYIDPGDRVLLKPNLLQAKPPGEHVTTHPALLEAVINLVKDVKGVPLVGDSPGASVGRDIERYWRITGLEEVCKRLNVELVNFEAAGSYRRTQNGKEYFIAKPALDAELLISLPKIKTHGLTLFTGAIKNLYGTVPGYTKIEYHKKAPHPSHFAEILVDIFALNQPCLHIIDGVIGMEGSGPSSGDPRELGMILAGEDGVALDSFICETLGRNPLKIPTNRIAYEQGLGEADLEKIQVLGDIPVIENFRWPPNIAYTLEMIPRPIARGIMKFWWTRPAIDPKKCKRECKRCIESCPTKALTEGVYIPEFDYSDCINCLCCMEMCPQKAMYNDKSLLYRLTSRFSPSD